MLIKMSFSINHGKELFKIKRKNTSPNNDFSQDMVWISAGTFTMGSNHHYSDESLGNKHWDRFLPSAMSI